MSGHPIEIKRKPQGRGRSGKGGGTFKDRACETFKLLYMKGIIFYVMAIQTLLGFDLGVALLGWGHGPEWVHIVFLVLLLSCMLVLPYGLYKEIQSYKSVS